MRLAIGLTVWFSATTTLMLILMQFGVELPEFFVLLPVIITMTYYLLPVRWVLILALFIKSVRANPFERLPRAHGIQVGFVVLVQLVLGLMSVVGLVLLWTETSKIGDRVAGFVFHACIPLVMLLFLARRSKRMDPVVPGPPVTTP